MEYVGINLMRDICAVSEVHTAAIPLIFSRYASSAWRWYQVEPELFAFVLEI